MSNKVKITHELLKAKLQQKLFPTGSLSATKRAVNYWEEQGLLEKPPHMRNRKFSFLDCLWIQMIHELQSFKIGNPWIKQVRGSLFGLNSEGTEAFMDACLKVIEMQLPIFIIINQDAEVQFKDHIEYQEKLKKEEILVHHVVLSLNKIVRSCFIQFWDTPVFDSTSELSTQELELLKMVREKRFQRIDIKMKDGSISMIEGVERIDTEKRIMDLLKEGKFQNIELKQENGKVVLINRRLKTKL